MIFTTQQTKILPKEGLSPSAAVVAAAVAVALVTTPVQHTPSCKPIKRWNPFCFQSPDSSCCGVGGMEINSARNSTSFLYNHDLDDSKFFWIFIYSDLHQTRNPFHFRWYTFSFHLFFYSRILQLFFLVIYWMKNLLFCLLNLFWL